MRIKAPLKADPMLTTVQEQMKTGKPATFAGTGLMEGGGHRDSEGVDRVAGPPDSLKPFLLALKEITEGERIVLSSEFRAAGGSYFGTIKKGQFNSTLVKLFKRIRFTDELLREITAAYGTGLPDTKWGGHTEVAWMDFAEDVSKAEGSGATDASSFAGKTRDADGTVDRVPDPPEALNKWLLVLKLKNRSAMINLPSTLREAGGTPMGTIPKGLFTLVLRNTYKEFRFTDQLLFSFAHAYGCGDVDIFEGGKKQVAWKDFCEDVNNQDERTATEEHLQHIRAACSVLG